MLLEGVKVVLSTQKGTDAKITKPKSGITIKAAEMLNIFGRRLTEVIKSPSLIIK